MTNKVQNIKNSSKISTEEAYKILNLDIKKNITKVDVKNAYIKIQKKIHPDISPETTRLSTIVNEAKEIILNNAKLTADEAKEIGLVNEVVEVNNSETRINALAYSMGEINQKILFAAKKAFQVNLEEEVQNAIKREKNLLKNIN